MRLTKLQSRAVAVAALAVFFALGISLVQQKNQRRRVAPAADISTETKAQPQAATESCQPAEDAAAFELQDFRRSEVKDGKKIWEIQADVGHYNPDSSAVNLDRAHLWVYRDAGEVIQLISDKALLHLKGNELVSADVNGHVTALRNDDLKIETEAATWDRVANIVTATGVVHLTSTKMDVSGRLLKADLTAKTIQLGADVESVIKPGHGADVLPGPTVEIRPADKAAPPANKSRTAKNSQRKKKK